MMIDFKLGDMVEHEGFPYSIIGIYNRGTDYLIKIDKGFNIDEDFAKSYKICKSLIGSNAEWVSKNELKIIEKLEDKK